MNFVFRVDASDQIGAGHVTRCCTLALELTSRGHFCKFVCQDLPGNHIQQIQELNLECVSINPSGTGGMFSQSEDAKQFLGVAEVQDFDWVIVDHYDLQMEWHERIKQARQKLCVIDDIARKSPLANLLVDQNFTVQYEKRYDELVSKSCIKLLGPKYAMVRSEFGSWREHSIQRERTVASGSLLVFLGGGDVYSATLSVLSSLLRANRKWKSVNVVVGEGCSHLEELTSFIAHQQNWYLHVQTTRMAELLSNADLAITGCGSISWEKCILGVPSFGIVLADNQLPIANALGEANAQINLGRIDDEGMSDNIVMNLNSITPDNLVRLSLNARKICDAEGAKRVATALIEHTNFAAIK